jgi:cytidylate kinase
MIIAIDGPAGSGKTTIAKLLAKKLGCAYLDTGAMYRALTLAALERNVDISDAQALSALARSIEITLDAGKVYLDKKDVTHAIRAPLIDKSISRVVTHPDVRSIMVQLQRDFARESDFAVEGRDITTVVFPNAEYKFYLDADPAIRAQRRHQELEHKGLKIDFKETQSDLVRRDHADTTRAVGALKRADDAHFIDTTNLTIEQVVQEMLSYIHSAKKD